MFKSANQKLGFVLWQLRKGAGVSQERFADTLRMGPARYGRIERGEFNISLKVLFGLSARLNLTPSTLLRDITVEDCIRQLQEPTPRKTRSSSTVQAD